MNSLKYKLFVAVLLAAVASCKPKAPKPSADAGGTADASKSAPNTSQPTPAVAGGYAIRTKHLDADGKPIYTNALAKESSPYLLQHAHNPVQWRPFGTEAFQMAKSLKRPILLSIGYSTCHWCHVMEEESFEDLEIAKFINDNYVAIKVDREERPDVDAVYMEAVQRIAGRGGWPMTLWLTPDGEPFHAATYIPPRAGVRGAHKGLIEQLQEWHKRFAEDPDKIVAKAKQISAQIAKRETESVDARRKRNHKEVLQRALLAYARSYDGTNHGWGQQKFPLPARLRFLLRAADYEDGDQETIAMVTNTLDAMANGGLFDHVGGGFHRYTTDPGWSIPHFEKMLYDNAMLVTLYTEAWQRTKNPRYEDVVRKTIAFIVRDLQSPDGGFYAAIDAGGEGDEGTHYLWTAQQIDEAAGQHAELLKQYFGVTAAGNFEGKNVLRAVMSRADAAKKLAMTDEEFEQGLRAGLDALRQARAKRAMPHIDKKVIAAWNGMAIEALSRAAFAFGELPWAQAAAKAATALPAEGVTLRRSRVGDRLGPEATADDHAFVIAGLIALFETTGDSVHLRRANLLQTQLDTRYWDPKNGGYFLAGPNNARGLIVRHKEFEDGAIPSANSVTALNLIKLAAFLDAKHLRERQTEVIGVALARLEKSGGAANAPYLMLSLDWMNGDPKEVAIVASGDTQALIQVLRTNFYPHYVLALPTNRPMVPWLGNKQPKNEKSTAYVCRNYACKLPTNEPEEFERQMREP